MAAETTLKLQPWIVPNFANAPSKPGKRQDGIDFNAAPCFALHELSAETLATLCDEFRAEVFRKAGKADPLLPAPRPQETTGGRYEALESALRKTRELTSAAESSGWVLDDAPDTLTDEAVALIAHVYNTDNLLPAPPRESGKENADGR